MREEKKRRCSIAATGHALVSQAAAVVLEEGGNAFDAAVAAGFAGAVAEQTLTSLGGGGFLLARTSGISEPVQEIFFDFFVDTPGRGLAHSVDPHFFPVTVDFGGSTQEFNIGLGSVAVPGVLKGLLHVHRRLGRLPLARVVAPAVELARGHELNSFQAGFLRLLHPIMTMSQTGRKLYEPGGEYMQAGMVLRNPELASFLEELPKDQGKSFYHGEIARAIDRDMRQGGGLLTREDLAGYRVREHVPMRSRFRDKTLLTCGAPSMGGPLIALSLSLLDALEPPAKWGSGEHLLRTLALMREVEDLRDKGMTTPQAVEAFCQGKKLEQSAQHIRLFSRGTTHISVADHEGNVASMTCSNGEGAGYFAPGTGIMLNNMMGEDDLHPEGFHSAPAGQRVGSMMAPSILLGRQGVELVLGSGGSKRIRSAITQVLTQIVDFNRDVQEAVDSPRLHWDGVTLQMEPGFPDTSIRVVQDHVPVNIWQEKSMYFGGVHVVVPQVTGVGDARRGGSVHIIER